MLNGANLQKGELKGIAKVLMKMQENKRDGNGIPSVQILAKYIKSGDLDNAVSYARSISSELWNYPEIRRFIHDVIYPIGYLDPETGMLVNDKE